MAKAKQKKSSEQSEEYVFAPKDPGAKHLHQGRYLKVGAKVRLTDRQAEAWRDRFTHPDGSPINVTLTDLDPTVQTHIVDADEDELIAGEVEEVEDEEEVVDDDEEVVDDGEDKPKKGRGRKSKK